MFDPESEILRIRSELAIRKKNRYCSSRLDRYKSEIVAMVGSGATPSEIQYWLRERNVKVVLSTVSRWLKKYEN